VAGESPAARRSARRSATVDLGAERRAAWAVLHERAARRQVLDDGGVGSLIAAGDCHVADSAAGNRAWPRCTASTRTSPWAIATRKSRVDASSLAIAKRSPCSWAMPLTSARTRARLGRPGNDTSSSTRSPIAPSVRVRVDSVPPSAGW
jgi:hypothetical protein